MARSTDSTPSSSDIETTESDAPSQPREIKSSPPEVSSMPGDASTEKISDNRGRHSRPRLGSRHSSTIIAPRSQASAEDVEENFPPDDARAMSPRRNTEETEQMEEATRTVVRE